MKKAANVLLTVNTVLCAILCVVLIGIPGLIFSIIGKKRLSIAKDKDDIIAFSILNIIFGTTFGFIAGILMLCMNDKDFEKPIN